MPIFEYHCSDCGSNFEKLVLNSQDKAEAASCSECGSETVEKLFSTFSAQSTNGDSAPACANQAAGVCQAGGGTMPCGMG